MNAARRLTIFHLLADLQSIEAEIETLIRQERSHWTGNSEEALRFASYFVGEAVGALRCLAWEHDGDCDPDWGPGG